MTLQTKRIDELTEITSPDPDVLLIVRDVAAGKDFKVRKSNLMTSASATYEWDAATSYSIDQLVSWGGLWWKSLINANVGNIPQEDTHWTQILAAQESSIQAFQASKVYKGDLVVVLQNDNIYRLSNATRPYTAATFIEADWTKIDGPLRLVLDTTTAPIVMDCKNAKKVILEGNNSIGAAKTWSFAHESAAEEITIQMDMTTTDIQTFPNSVKASPFTGGWDVAAYQFTPSQAGGYELVLTKRGAYWWMKINGPF